MKVESINQVLARAEFHGEADRIDRRSIQSGSVARTRHKSGIAIILLLSVVICNCAHGVGQRAPEPAATPAGPSDSEIDAGLLRAATEALGEREGCVLVMDPANGRIRALVNPRLAYEQAYPPGSTIKAFTSLAAMRSGLIDSHSAIRCAGQYAGKEFQVVCSHPKSDAPFDLPQALAYSCNYYFARTAERLSNGAFQSTLAGFGFGARTGVTGSESPGRIPGPDWNIKTALGEGDQLLVTPIQLLRGYVALMCGGRLFRPRQADAQGFKADEVGSQSISGPERAALVRGMRGAVSFGTAAESGLKSLPLYVFGKTGTSTSSSGFRTQGWFVGFASASEANDRPLIAVLAFLKHSHGSECAALTSPIFAEYARLLLPASPEINSARRYEIDRSLAAIGKPVLSEHDISSQARPTVFSHLSRETVGNPSGGTGVGVAWRAPQSVKVHLVRENVTRTVPLEQYVLGVLRAEASIEDRVEALKAQAIISRTFALKNAGRHRNAGYDFCSLTHCERYSETPMKGDRDTLARKAVAETEGQVLSDERGALIDPYFHASCGGMTADIGTLWGVAAPGYLRGVRDDYCRSMPNNNWVQRIPAERLARALQSDPKTDVGSRLTGIQIVKRDHTGRAELLQLDGKRRAVIRGWDFKMVVGRSLGWNMIKSSRFEAARDGADFVFRGSGFGHGLGMCQEGAHEMARLGFSYSQIISHYFPGTSVAPNPGLSQVLSATSLQAAASTALPTWISGPVVARVAYAARASNVPGAAVPGSAGFQPASAPAAVPGAAGFQPASAPTAVPGAAGFQPASAPAAVPGAAGFQPASAPAAVSDARALQTLSSEHFTARCNSSTRVRDIESVLDNIESARTDLLGRLDQASLSLSGESKVQLVFHSTTQEFMAVTGQPWWAAAATRGAIIDLQPLALLKRRRILATTVRHEYAHYVIDRLSNGKAPRWLAEGLAAYFAGESAMLAGYKSPRRLSTDEIEHGLSRTGSPQEMRSLYAASLRAVEEIIKASGEQAIWKRLSLGSAGLGRCRYT